MKINQKGFAPILIILLVLLVGAVGYFVYVKNSEPSQPIVEQMPPIHKKTLASSTAAPSDVPKTGSSSVLPPNPGEAGKATLQGIDSDNDGVRDDIQRYIALTYPDSEKTRAALTQTTKAIQTALVDANDKQASIRDATVRLNASDCLYYVLGLDRSGSVFKDLLPQILNTSARSRAFILADNQLGGQVFELLPKAEEKLRCDFDPDTMPN